MQLYIHSIIDSVISAHINTAKKITFTKEIDDLELSIDTALPLGIIINEGISNSLKHAFKDTQNARLDIILKPYDPNQYLLSIKDNGSGFLNKNSQNKSLGFELIEMLCAQINGSCTIGNSDNKIASIGTSITIIFKSK